MPSSDEQYKSPQPAIDALFDRLAGSRFRRQFALGPRERTYLRERGLPAVIEHARNFVTQRLAPAKPHHDGKQTPMRGHPVFIAQHATATCCRSCLAKWHTIDKGRPLTDAEIDYILTVIAHWLTQQINTEHPPRQSPLFD